MFYFVKTPKWVKKLYSGCIWQMPDSEKVIYLTFDDGPHPEITPFVLDELKKYGGQASFFCVGRNVLENPVVYQRILDEGHAVGNHSFDHLNGWKTDNQTYLANVLKAGEYINSRFFRPPYGRITRKQQRDLTGLAEPFRIIMWNVLSGDFDVRISGEQCYKNVIENAGSGAIVVLHDSEKANERMRYCLPKLLSYFSESGYVFKKISINNEG